MGRMWNTLLLCKWKPIFAWIPVETVIQERQDAYYGALSEADRIANATPFVEFLLKVILDTLIEIEGEQIPTERINPYIQLFLDKPGNDELRLAKS
mgnify:FL=1